jgi:hypothetical protein
VVEAFSAHVSIAAIVAAGNRTGITGSRPPFDGWLREGGFRFAAGFDFLGIGITALTRRQAG